MLSTDSVGRHKHKGFPSRSRVGFYIAVCFFLYIVVGPGNKASFPLICSCCLAGWGGGILSICLVSISDSREWGGLETGFSKY